ncbi:hypothetical protein QAD02_016452 [Eretmocerus hayati]|uniref:Uncharacterized protein n=1 Tax=Eretmocerus hayati TaxID=131215 RepID=A0ACC2PAP9_9HYME|nr:hypothetical protein QAD02_016452 [Eretmocerus hayati]
MSDADQQSAQLTPNGRITVQAVQQVPGVVDGLVSVGTFLKSGAIYCVWTERASAERDRIENPPIYGPNGERIISTEWLSQQQQQPGVVTVIPQNVDLEEVNDEYQQQLIQQQQLQFFYHQQQQQIIRQQQQQQLSLQQQQLLQQNLQQQEQQQQQQIHQQNYQQQNLWMQQGQQQQEIKMMEETSEEHAIQQRWQNENMHKRAPRFQKHLQQQQPPTNQKLSQHQQSPQHHKPPKRQQPSPRNQQISQTQQSTKHQENNVNHAVGQCPNIQTDAQNQEQQQIQDTNKQQNKLQEGESILRRALGMPAVTKEKTESVPTSIGIEKIKIEPRDLPSEPENAEGPGCSFWTETDVNHNLPTGKIEIYSATPHAVWPKERPKIPTNHDEQKDFMIVFMGRKGHKMKRRLLWRDLLEKNQQAQGVYYENKDKRIWKCVYRRPGNLEGWEMKMKHEVGLAEIYENPEPCAFNDGQNKVCNQTPLELTEAKQCVFCCLTLDSNLETVASKVPVIAESVKKEVFPVPESQSPNLSSGSRKNLVPEGSKEKFKKRNRKKVMILIISVIATLFVIILLFWILEGHMWVKFMMKLDVCDSEECMRVAASLKETMNTSIDPCDDFYSYVCGRWPESHPSLDLSQEHSWFREKSAKVTRTIRDLLVKNFTAQNLPWAVSEARTLFESCMDVDSWNRLNLVPMLELLEELSLPQIPATISKNSLDFITQMAKTKRVLGIDVFFGMYIAADPKDTSRNVIVFDLPERESPFPSDKVVDKRLKQIKKRALKYSRTLSESNGEDLDEDSAKDSIIELEKTYMAEVFKQLISNGTVDQPICSSRGAFTITPESDIEDSVSRILELSQNFEDLEAGYHNRTSEDDIDVQDSDYILLDDLQQVTDDFIKLMNDSLEPKMFWRQFVDEVLDGILEFDQERKVLVSNIDYLKDVSLILAAADEDLLETVIWWTVIDYAVPYSSQNLRRIWIEHVEKILGSGVGRARSIFCAENVQDLMGMAVAWLFVKPSFMSDGSRDNVQEMLDLIKESFSKYVAHLDWMDKLTKNVTVDKNNKMKSLIGYPKWLFNETKLDSYYDGINMTDDNYFHNMIQIIRLQKMNELSKLAKKNTDSDEQWPVNPTDVNAAHSFQDNEIAIPAGILQYPFYGLGLEALNYGAIGTILGHELTHGFDNSGRRFDSHGNLKQWWSNETISKYTSKTTCFVDQYNEFYLPEIADHIDGELTLGENIADNGGLREAYSAYQRWSNEHGRESLLPGFVDFTHDQLFFMSYAHIWCESYTPQALHWMMYDPHCPGPVRLRMTLRNSQHFSKIWRCPKGSPMNPNKKCELW